MLSFVGRLYNSIRIIMTYLKGMVVKKYLSKVLTTPHLELLPPLSSPPPLWTTIGHLNTVLITNEEKTQYLLIGFKTR